MDDEKVSMRKEANRRCVPFLKWAGGKRWISQRHDALLPTHYERYFEPFLGSGAMFFATKPQVAHLSDVNPELIRTFNAIKENPRLVERYLREHSSRHSKNYYYQIRDKKPKSQFSIAARMIYLNRTCWNGLYRVNQQGNFNVPIGTNKKATLPTDDFVEVSNLLKLAQVKVADFEEQIDKADQDDFIFVDPPYTVKHNVNGFVQYNEKLFQYRDQIRLRDSLLDAHSRGALFLLTNANHESIRELYDFPELHLTVTERNSVVASSSKFRVATTELLVTNYPLGTGSSVIS